LKAITKCTLFVFFYCFELNIWTLPVAFLLYFKNFSQYLSTHPASYHEVRSLKIRYRKSKWLRFLVESFGLMGDRGYRGCEYVEVCESKKQKGIRQMVEGVNSQIKLLNRVSRWRKGITLLAYLYGYAIGS
jgi:hypothetical protein